MKQTTTQMEIGKEAVERHSVLLCTKLSKSLASRLNVCGLAWWLTIQASLSMGCELLPKVYTRRMTFVRLPSTLGALSPACLILPGRYEVHTWQVETKHPQWK